MNLNFSNRLVRTRMPGGVGGDRSGILTAPIPIIFAASPNNLRCGLDVVAPYCGLIM